MAKSDKEAQIARFREAARDIGADHEAGADKLMGRMATMKPEPRPKPPRKREETEDDKPGQ